MWRYPARGHWASTAPLSRPATIEVATQKTFTDWVACIKALFEWGVLDDSLATKLYELREAP